MEDRFKFRVWNKVHKKMYPSTKDVNLAISLETMLEEKHLVVMQCTGIKDNFQKLIYEGDVVQHTYSERIYQVVWGSGMFLLETIDGEQYCETFNNLCSLKILGNIWQNLELLESNNND